MLDFEKAKKNTELKKKMPGYVAYDDTEEDEFGVVSCSIKLIVTVESLFPRQLLCDLSFIQNYFLLEESKLEESQ